MVVDFIIFIGGGNMVCSLIVGLICQGVLVVYIYVVELVVVLCELLVVDFGVQVYDNVIDVVVQGSVWLLVVKLQVLCEVCQLLQVLVQVNWLLVVLIVVGIISVQLECWLGGNLLVVCVMFNIFVLFGVGVIGLYVMFLVDLQQYVQVEQVLVSVGCMVWIECEVLMDLVIVVFGSGLVYVFLLVEVMEVVGIVQGLLVDVVCMLVVQILLGVLCMLDEVGESLIEFCCCVMLFNGIIQVVIESFQVGGFEVLVDIVLCVVQVCGQELFVVND